MNSNGSIAEESVYNNTLAEAEIFAYSIVKKYGKYGKYKAKVRARSRRKKIHE